MGPGFDPLKAFWKQRNTETENTVRALLAAEATKYQYTQGVRNPAAISPDSYIFDQHFLDRKGNDAIQLNLLYNYQSNPPLYPEWQAYFRKFQPRTLIVWGQNDPYFTVEGAKAYQRDLPQAELHLLDTGHFALEEDGDLIADHITRFLLT